MKIQSSRRNLWLAGSCLVCIALNWISGGPGIEGSEFTGGRITGPILSLSDAGLLLFIAALVLSFFSSRIAGVIAVLASVLCLPFYIYSLAPGPFRDLFKGEYSVPLTSRFVCDKPSIVASVFLVVTLGIGIRATISRPKLMHEACS